MKRSPERKSKRAWCLPPNKQLQRTVQTASRHGARAPRFMRQRAAANCGVRRHRGSTSRFGLGPLEPDGERLVAYLERRTPWDS